MDAPIPYDVDGRILREIFNSSSYLFTKPEKYVEEKICDFSSGYPSKLPNILSKIGVIQLSKIEKYNSVRREISRKYLKVFEDFSSKRY